MNLNRFVLNGFTRPESAAPRVIDCASRECDSEEQMNGSCSYATRAVEAALYWADLEHALIGTSVGNVENCNVLLQRKQEDFKWPMDAGLAAGEE